MTYIISGYNPRAGLRGDDWLSPDYWTKMVTDKATAAADAAAIAVGLKPAPKAAPAPASTPAQIARMTVPFPMRLGTPTFGTQGAGYTPPEEKDNTMLYVGGAVALVAVLALMQKK